jgi:hypothetical protein
VYRGDATWWIEATTDRDGLYEIDELYDRDERILADRTPRHRGQRGVSDQLRRAHEATGQQPIV